MTRRGAWVGEASLAVAALVAACARDYAVPGRPEEAPPPALEGFSPTGGFAGDRLELRGTGFDAAPASNEVRFPRASARGEGLTPDGALVVHVPEDAGTGPLSLVTPRGASPPAGSSSSSRPIA